MIEQMGSEIGEEHQARDDPRPPNVHESCANLLRGKRAVYAPQARAIRLGAKVRAERHATLRLSPNASRPASSSRRYDKRTARSVFDRSISLAGCRMHFTARRPKS
jgi:hypothetical protein